MLTLDLYSSSIPVDPVTISTYYITVNLVVKMQLAIHKKLDIYWCLARLAKASLDYGTVQVVYVTRNYEEIDTKCMSNSSANFVISPNTSCLYCDSLDGCVTKKCTRNKILSVSF
jgi:hypothetical protein